MVKVTEELISPQLLLDSLKIDSSGSIVMHSASCVLSLRVGE